MKKLIIVATLTLGLLAISLKASAAPELLLGPITLGQGETASLMLRLENGDEPYAGVNAKILLPAGISVTGISRGTLLSSADFKVAFHEDTDGVENWVTVIAYSGTDVFNADNGNLLIIYVRADWDSIPGDDYQVGFAAENANPLVNSKYALSNEDGSESIEPDVSPGTITIVATADADEDGLSDSWEQRIIDAVLDDEYEDIDDVEPLDDFDGDGFSNLREALSDSDATDIHDIPYCWADFYEDGDVDGDDLGLIADEFHREDCSIEDPCNADLYLDDLVDDLDLLFFTEDYGRTDCN